MSFATQGGSNCGPVVTPTLAGPMLQLASSAYTVPSNVLTIVPGMSFMLRAGATYLYEVDVQVSNTPLTGNDIFLAMTYSGATSRFLQGGTMASGHTAIDNEVNNNNGGELDLTVIGGQAGIWLSRIAGALTTTSIGNLYLRARRANATVTVLPAGKVWQVT